MLQHHLANILVGVTWALALGAVRFVYQVAECIDGVDADTATLQRLLGRSM